ncbi:MAG: SCP2 sterol-binding domain-containing protein [Clostridia bacterium]|nr:SCP2 sterol-binding domain-containing protein [Clostridia bacterium]
MTFQEKFDELKKTYFDTTLFTGADGDFAAEITLTDPDCGGTFYLKKTGGKIDMEPYDYKDSTVKLTLPSELLEDILNNRVSAVAAFMDGRLDAEGDVNHALSLVNALKKQKPKKRRSDTKKV